ncbi:hypothetical protein H6P81_008126 [Aristolochia fimbriata]|uniref:RING-type E3 ubiquitin transferase n=1 Tax=Aristolochia fimbriata TaxID=158543 RepID=A0AAV7F609_ARIFI|nr:hypothetical protein H6P81_008126 [Aristolochia fimbriata]
MAISPREFPAKRRAIPTAAPPSRRINSGADVNLLRSLLLVAREISDSAPLNFPPQKRNSGSIARKTRLLSLLFEELAHSERSQDSVPPSALICLNEILLVLQRIKAMLDQVSGNGCSRFWLLVQTEQVSNAFHEAELDLGTLLDILPMRDLDLGEDVLDQVSLVKNQCRRSTLFVDPVDDALRSEVANLIKEIEREIVPNRSRLRSLFDRVGIRDSRGCRDEIKALESEIQNQVSDKSTATIAALAGLVQYSKCVLYGASTPRSSSSTAAAASTSKSTTHSAAPIDLSIPSDFRCPISLELMRDPVVVATGQTYDRTSIGRWIEAGHDTCPKTGQTLSHTALTPNRALKSLIAKWCREMHIPFDSTDITGAGGVRTGTAGNCKAAMEATRMTAQFLVERLREEAPLAPEAANRVVHELRALAKTGSENRAWIAEAGAVSLLVPLLDSDNPGLQTNAVTALLNLSILEENKMRIMEAEGGIEAVVRVLESGATWEGRENAAATLMSLSAANVCRKRIWREPRVVAGLVELLRTGPPSSKRDALAAILNLAGEREAVGMLVGGGAVGAALAAAADEGFDSVEEAVAVVAALAKRGGASAIAATAGAVETLVGVLNCGTERARECAAAALVSVCRRGRSPASAELAATPGIQQMIFDLLGSGTPRARLKAAALLQICHRWAIACRTVAYAPHSAMAVS